MQTIHKRIKEMRTKTGLTLKEIAEKIGITEATAQRYESGLVNNIPYDRIEKLAEIFMVSPAYLMGWEEYSTANTQLKQHPLLEIYDNLNSNGQKRLMDYAQDLSQLPQYKKCDTVSEQEIS